MSIGKIQGEGIRVMQTGSPRKPSKLVFAGALWDAGLRQRGRVGLQQLRRNRLESSHQVPAPQDF